MKLQMKVWAALVLGSVALLGGCQVIRDGAGIDRAAGARLAATTAVSDLKAAYANRAGDPAYVAAIGKYNAAADSVNAWLERVASSLETGPLPISVPASAFDDKEVLVESFLADAGRLTGGTSSGGAAVAVQTLEVFLWFAESQRTEAVARARALIESTKWTRATP